MTIRLQMGMTTGDRDLDPSPMTPAPIRGLGESKGQGEVMAGSVRVIHFIFYFFILQVYLTNLQNTKPSFFLSFRQ
jgi:hypothetical protein